jgi:hypothetical protein
MAKLTAAEREASPHAGPGDSFPIPNKRHAVQALRERKFAKDPAAIVRNVKKRFPTVGGSLLAVGLKKK